MAPREIAYDLSLHIYSPPFANTSRKRLSIKHISLYHDSRPFFFSERKVHISVRAAATAHSLSSLRKATPIDYNISLFFLAFCTVIYIAILRRDGFEALGGMDDAAECRRAVDADLFEFVSEQSEELRDLQTASGTCGTTIPIVPVFRRTYGVTPFRL